MTEKIEDGKLKPQCGRRGSVLRNSAALLALSIFVGPLLPQAALADCGSGVTFTCTGNDTDGKTVNITTSSGTGTMVAGPPAATISNASGSVPLTVNFLNFVYYLINQTKVENH